MTPLLHCVLRHAAVDVWSAVLDQPEPRQREFSVWLDAEEMTVAGQCSSLMDRRRYVAGRGILRALLGSYIGMEPGEVRFTYQARGKPGLSGPCGGGQIHFSKSHSGGYGLYAVGRGRMVGVDVERLRAVWNLDSIARRFFSPHDNAALQELTQEQRHSTFFRYWTRKEAYSKGRGEGISSQWRQFDVAAGTTTPGWKLEDVTTPIGYMAALAVQDE